MGSAAKVAQPTRLVRRYRVGGRNTTGCSLAGQTADHPTYPARGEMDSCGEQTDADRYAVRTALLIVPPRVVHDAAVDGANLYVVMRQVGRVGLARERAKEATGADMQRASAVGTRGHRACDEDAQSEPSRSTTARRPPTTNTTTTSEAPGIMLALHTEGFTV